MKKSYLTVLLTLTGMTGATGSNCFGNSLDATDHDLQKCGLEYTASPESRWSIESRVRHSRLHFDTLVRVYVSLIEGQPLSCSAIEAGIPQSWPTLERPVQLKEYQRA